LGGSLYEKKNPTSDMTAPSKDSAWVLFVSGRSTLFKTQLPASGSHLLAQVCNGIKHAETGTLSLRRLKAQDVYFDGVCSSEWLGAHEKVLSTESAAPDPLSGVCHSYVIAVSHRVPNARPLTFAVQGIGGRLEKINVSVELALHELGILNQKSQVSLGAIVARVIAPIIEATTAEFCVQFKGSDATKNSAHMLRLEHALHKSRLIVSFPAPKT
jgi:hypothetical protein